MTDDKQDTCVHEWGILSRASASNGLRWCRKCGMLWTVKQGIGGLFGGRPLPAVGNGRREDS